MSGHYPDSMLFTPACLQNSIIAALLFALPSLAAQASELDSWLAEKKLVPAPHSPVEHNALANSVLIRALSLVGTPYVWGGNTPESGFDCSGLVNYVFRDMLNLRLPRTSRELSALAAPAVAESALATGDLVFFAHNGTVSHVGIYVGDGRFIHAPRSGGTVRMERLDGRYWQTRYAGARRVLDSLSRAPVRH
ncbi:hypothetical protein CO610_01765 [Lysobacteraceae bacterium NML95-0200]|nr:hypothetical protein CO610_01765 [Xanthomonadaceae bacterium NML95-0200]